MNRRPPKTRRNDTLVPYTTLFRSKLNEGCDRHRAILGIPEDYRIAIVPASDTGAVEMALWSLLGARGVDVLAWENFGKTWATDIAKQLKLPDTRLMEADPGLLPDLGKVDPDRDVRSEEHTSELQSLMRISYAVFCLKKKKETE